MTTSTVANTDVSRTRFFIDGQWMDPQGNDRFTAIEAGTGTALGTASLASGADIDMAVRAAHSALVDGPWSHTTATERSAAMRRFADALQARGDETARLCSRENGMPIRVSTIFNGVAAPSMLRLMADVLDRTPIEEVVDVAGGRAIVRREPVGVVGAITPWNFPQSTALLKVAPALASGSTIVLKHSPDAAFDTYMIADAAQEAGIPAGVVNVVLGGVEAGQALVTHPLVDKIAFTGSTAAGRWIASECGKLIRRVTLELGGKSAAIVCDDVDLSVLYQGLANASFTNNSQTCTTQSRILAARSRYDEIVETVAQFARDMVVGDPLDTATTCGPMAGEHHLKKVMGYIDIARDSNARLVAGGGRPAGLDRGWFVEPTVFADVDNDDRLAREEVFGPVIAVIPFDDDDDAVRIANDSNYGLGGSVWSADSSRALGLARRVRTGTIGVNNYDSDLTVPFGGMKESGLGREHGQWGLENYFEYKSLYLGEADVN
jgi:acyl-CoA reductase-like NAD-dependent aldehyde dehydrogenase